MINDIEIQFKLTLSQNISRQKEIPSTSLLSKQGCTLFFLKLCKLSHEQRNINYNILQYHIPSKAMAINLHKSCVEKSMSFLFATHQVFSKGETIYLPMSLNF